MLPTFVIGLREGLEAALIVGIIAAFLRKQGRGDLLRWVMGGVGAAVVLCVCAGVALQVYSHDLPQKQQEGLETIVGALAVGMVTYMVIWMRRNSRNLKAQLEGLAADALGGESNAARAMIGMAFLAVIREGLETVVFALAAFNESANGTTAGLGLLLGITVAVGMGYGIYRGGVRVNLSKFFRVTGVVLVFVAAGIVVNALHTAHEAGWINAGQGRTVNLSWLVDPGSVRSSLLTGMLGLQPRPVTIEVVGWLLYLIPVGLYVGWPPGRPVPHTKGAFGSAALAGAACLGAVVAAMTAPAAPAQRPVTVAAGPVGGALAAVVTDRADGLAHLQVTSQQPVARTSGADRIYRVDSMGPTTHLGRAVEAYRARIPGSSTAALPSTLSPGRAAKLNGGRLPLGIKAADGSVDIGYDDDTTLTVWLDTHTDRVLDLRWDESIQGVLHSRSGAAASLARPVATGSVSLPASARSEAAEQAHRDQSTLASRASARAIRAWLISIAIFSGLSMLTFAALARRRRRSARRRDGALIDVFDKRTLID